MSGLQAGKDPPAPEELAEELAEALNQALDDNPQILIGALEKIFNQGPPGGSSGPPPPLQEITPEDRALLLDGPTIRHTDPSLSAPPLLELVEFYDYRCPYCRAVSPDVEEFVTSDRRTNWILKDIPILGPQSEELAALSVAASLIDESAFAGFHKDLMKEQSSPDPEQARALAAARGYDLPFLEEKAASPEVLAILDSNLRLARRIRVDSTPSFVLFHQESGLFRVFVGAAPVSEMEDHARSLREEILRKP